MYVEKSLKGGVVQRRITQKLGQSHLLHSLFDIFHCVGSNQGMQRLIFPWQHLSILSAHLALLHRTFTPDHDLGTAFLLNVLQSITTRKTQNIRPLTQIPSYITKPLACKCM